MKLSAEFYWEEYVNNWEIDYHNDLNDEEKEYLSRELKIPFESLNKVFYKKGNNWNTRVGGMTFKITGFDLNYKIIKEHLDNKLKEFLRNKKINELGI